MKPIYVRGIGLGLAATSSMAAAQMPGWYGPRGPGYGYSEPPGFRDSREGRIEVQTFIATSARIAELGHGPISIVAGPGPAAPRGVAAGSDPSIGDGLFETALAGQLGHAGYQPGAPGPGQMIEYAVTRELIQPPEPPHSPVSGGVDVGTSNRGSGMGIGIMIDLSKPRGALVATRIEARISDTVTHELLWQGRAEVLARETDKRWRPELMADRLTSALFKTFPRPTRG